MKEKMLVIDDEQIVLESCKKIFTAEGFEVEVAQNPMDGIQRTTEVDFDVILCDWKMPGFDGMDVVEKLNRLAPDATVIMISGYPSVSRATEAMKRGALDYVSKPFTPEEILQAVRQAVQKKASEEKQVLRRFEKVVKSFTFPTSVTDDQPPRSIAEIVASKVGVGKVTSPWLTVFILGILAGAYIGFGGLLSTAVTFDLAPIAGVGFKKFLAGSVFSVGLILVVIAGAELFTGNNLMISSVMTRDITLGIMIKRWVFVYVANFIGSLFLALMFYFSGLWKTGNGAMGAAAVGIAYGKVNLTFMEALIRAVGCNWLVCLAVWMALASRQVISKIWAIYFPIMAFVAIGFEHCIANMYFIPAGIFLHSWANVSHPLAFDPQSLTWATFLIDNLLPVTIGNIIGGAVFVGMSYWSAFLRVTNTPNPHGRNDTAA